MASTFPSLPQVEKGELDLRPAVFITRGGKQFGTVVAWEVGGFMEVEGKSQPRPLVTPVT
jgi:hypothetical protein